MTNTHTNQPPDPIVEYVGYLSEIDSTMDNRYDPNIQTQREILIVNDAIANMILSTM